MYVTQDRMGGVLLKHLVASLLLFLVLVPACVSLKSKSATSQAYLEADENIRVFVEAYYLVREQYVDTTSTDRLVSAAIAGMEEMLSSQEYVFIKTEQDLPENLEEKQALDAFSAALAHYSKTIDISHRPLEHAAIKGMLKSLDAGSTFFSPELYAGESEKKFGGIGLQVSMKENRPIVIAPIDGTPAQKAGIRAGDHITQIDNEQAGQLTQLEVVQRLRGPVGTTITIMVERQGEPEPLLFTLIREHIILESVQKKVIDDRIGYVRLIKFDDSTGKELSRAIAELREQDIRAFILDLRNNPGGFLRASVEVAQLFLEPGKQILSMKVRDGKVEEYVAYPPNILKDIPMVVLVNEGSSAGSEIVAGALQEWGRAVIIGAQTFGRGSVKTILPLHDGSAMKLTTGRSYTPRGRSIEDKIQPDVMVEETKEEDRPLFVAIEKIKARLQSQ